MTALTLLVSKMNANQALKMCTDKLVEGKIENARYEAMCLIEKVFGLNHSALIVYGNDEVDSDKLCNLNELVNRRLNREPLQYILGSWSFCGFDFEVGEGVLIPRDDTEVVLNLCLDFLKNKTDAKVIDLCAGSGAISVALQKLSNANVTGIELSDKAFEYFNRNIKLNNSSVKAVKGDILKCYNDFNDDEFDLIVSNPPYIKSEDILTLQSEVQKEPKMALDGGVDGFDFYKSIISNWTSKLKNGGTLAFELGENQADYVKQLMTENKYTNITTELDLGGTQRAIIGTVGKK